MGSNVLPFKSPVFLKNPCFKKKNEAENINFVANFRLEQTGIISSKVVIFCQTRKATENIWNLLLCLQRQSLSSDL